MKRYLYIGFGGALGSLARYFISGIPGNNWWGYFPGNTFIINISGSFLLGLFLTSVLEFVEMDSNLRLAVSTGFIGSYTTFSTFTNELNAIYLDGRPFAALFYLTLSITSGLFSIWIGTIAARKYFATAARYESEE